MTTVNQVADHIIVALHQAKKPLSVLKLQKLLYYVQAWSLATRGAAVFPNKFQAWVHGPVCREIYDRFKDSHMLYDNVLPTDKVKENAAQLSEDVRAHVDEVLDAYRDFSGIELESMTHDELPWKKARGNLSPSARCEAEIDEGLMADFYAKLLQDIAGKDA